MRVPDGDGLTILSPPGGAGRRWDRLRLWGIDAPEFPDQPFGYEAREGLIALVAMPGSIQRKGRQVAIRIKPGITGWVRRVHRKGGGGRDPYGRTVVTLHDARGLCINEALVEAGLAWQYYDDGAYSQAQRAAIVAGRGVHKPELNSVKPWDWRKQNPKAWPLEKGTARRRGRWWWLWVVAAIVLLLAAWGGGASAASPAGYETAGRAERVR